MSDQAPGSHTIDSLTRDLRALGLREGDVVMVHSSFRALRIGDPELIVQALLGAVGEGGALLMPALSYMQQPPLAHSTRDTPSCVGFLPEYFRTRPGSVRSLHPTHSVCGVGRRATELLGDHGEDDTPCGPRSPFSKTMRLGGKILMLGCGLRPNTSMHAVEEHVRPPYLFGEPVTYTITDGDGRTFQKRYTPHGFHGVAQRYDRVEQVLPSAALRRGSVGSAQAHLIDAAALLSHALGALRRDPLFFVEREG
jgi:aminoglycoside 3-N-acetyltransferase